MARYRLYLDESGDHTSTHVTDIGKRYLGLVGVMFEQETAYREFADGLTTFKQTCISADRDEVPILHREEILNKRGEFSCLRDPEKKRVFDNSLLEMIETAQFTVFAVVVDKHMHRQAAYRKLVHPYHYGLLAVLERYCKLLGRLNSTGDVMAEARGASEDMLLKSAYSEMWQKGMMCLNPKICRETLTSKELKVKPKRANVAGLQLADLLAHPLTRDVLYAYRRIPSPLGEFTTCIRKIGEGKYDRHWKNSDRINGYGRVILS